VLTKEEHATLLRSFAVDRLLQLVTLEAKRRHDGHVTIVALTTHYQGFCREFYYGTISGMLSPC
jgi:hypothetical protein